MVKSRRRTKKVWTVCSKECYDRCCECSETCANYFICMKLARELKSEPPIKALVMELISEGIPFPSYLDDDYVNRLAPKETNVLVYLFTVSNDSFDLMNDIRKCAVAMNTGRDNIASALTNMCDKFADFFPNSDESGINRFTNFVDWARETILPKLIQRGIM